MRLLQMRQAQSDLRSNRSHPNNSARNKYNVINLILVESHRGNKYTMVIDLWGFECGDGKVIQKSKSCLTQI